MEQRHCREEMNKNFGLDCSFLLRNTIHRCWSGFRLLEDKLDNCWLTVKRRSKVSVFVHLQYQMQVPSWINYKDQSLNENKVRCSTWTLAKKISPSSSFSCGGKKDEGISVVKLLSRGAKNDEWQKIVQLMKFTDQFLFDLSHIMLMSIDPRSRMRWCWILLITK